VPVDIPSNTPSSDHGLPRAYLTTVPLAIFLGVGVIALLVLRPDPMERAWTALKAQPESRAAQARLDRAAATGTARRIRPGTYRTRYQEGRTSLTQIMVLPQGTGNGPQQAAPFTYLVQLQTPGRWGGQEERNVTIKGQAYQQRNVLVLRPDGPTYLLLNNDRTLLKAVTPESFTVISARVNQDDEPSVFRRDP